MNTNDGNIHLPLCSSKLEGIKTARNTMTENQRDSKTTRALDSRRSSNCSFASSSTRPSVVSSISPFNQLLEIGSTESTSSATNSGTNSRQSSVVLHRTGWDPTGRVEDREDEPSKKLAGVRFNFAVFIE
ncbi:hypothetical protein HK100_000017 [Physocladia obscura]|uniref:Uncharacterized protein n=1 Tax=Physocladia obscura TaxID=109957 RepID=A0AAD5TBU3_9FUNG|nr:hypothetical protein HK100_000017 [Physocladia obscura]